MGIKIVDGPAYVELGGEVRSLDRFEVSLLGVAHKVMVENGGEHFDQKSRIDLHCSGQTYHFFVRASRNPLFSVIEWHCGSRFDCSCGSGYLPKAWIKAKAERERLAELSRVCLERFRKKTGLDVGVIFKQCGKYYRVARFSRCTAAYCELYLNKKLKSGEWSEKETWNSIGEASDFEIIGKEKDC